MWIVEDVRVEEYSSMKIKGRAFFLKDKWKIYGITFARKYGIREIEKQEGDK